MATANLDRANLYQVGIGTLCDSLFHLRHWGRLLCFGDTCQYAVYMCGVAELPAKGWMRVIMYGGVLT